jgi:hypothetical protein
MRVFALSKSAGAAQSRRIQQAMELQALFTASLAVLQLICEAEGSFGIFGLLSQLSGIRVVCVPLATTTWVLLLLPLQSASALTYDQLQGLTYLQVKGSGIANTCPVLESGSTNLKVHTIGCYAASRS